METLASEVSPEKPGGRSLINGVNICRLVIGAATISLLVATATTGQPFYLLLALLCAVAAAVKTDNLRRVISSIVVLFGMYFAAELFVADYDSIIINLFAIAGSALVFVAITRLRHWESVPQDFPRRLRITSVVLGVVLLVNAAGMALAPVASSQFRGAACGNVIAQKSATHAWTGVSVAGFKSDCSTARRDRAAFAFLQLELAIGLLYIGRKVVRRYPLRISIITGVLLVVFGGGAFGWNEASIENANRHNAAFEPWVNRYSDQFAQQSLTNSQLRAALKANDAQGVASACQELVAVDNNLAGSINDWPLKDSTHDDWAEFVSSHSEESKACFQKASEIQPGGTINISGWFAQSSAAIKKLQHQIGYW